MATRHAVWAAPGKAAASADTFRASAEAARAPGRRSAVVLAVLISLAVAGCGGTHHPPAAGPGSPEPIPSATPGGACLTAHERAGVIRFPSDNGASIAGVVLGAPRAVGVVLAHESGGDMCEWVPYGRTLAALGYTVLAIDLNGCGASSFSRGNPSDPRWDLDVVAAAGQLRHRGVAKVALLGASLGGTSVMVAAAELRPAPAAVVDLSGAASLSGLDAVAAAPKVAGPILFVSGAQDRATDDVRAVSAAATRASPNRLEIIPDTASHGVTLLDPATEPRAGQVSALVQDFLHRYAG